MPTTDNATPAPPTPAAPGVTTGERQRRGLRYEDFTLGDLTAIRNLLRGGSVIDWHRLYFTDREEVDRFLRVNEIDPADENDMRRLGELREAAVEYLERHLGFQIPDEVAHGVPPRDLLLIASQKGRRRTHACVVLKVMHVMHHLAGRELLTKLPVSDDQIFHLIEEKVLRTVEELKAIGCPVVEFEWSRKHADSLITKLLAKKESIAADVYDKLRFRMITNTEEQLIFVMRELTQRLIPFNFVIPGQSENDIIKIRETLDRSPSLKRFLPEITDLAAVAADKKPSPQNEFSGPGLSRDQLRQRSAGPHRQVPVPAPRRSDVRRIRHHRLRADRVPDHRRAHRREQRERREQPRQVQGPASRAREGPPHARHEGRSLSAAREPDAPCPVRGGEPDSLSPRAGRG